MLTFPTTVSDAELLDTIRQWNDALAHRDIATAFAMTYHGPEDSWTPTLLAEAASSYDGADDGSLAQITPWNTAIVADLCPSHSVTWFEQPNAERSPSLLGYVWVDLPYRGRWSDVTAIFNILLIDAHLVLELESIHVM